MQSKKREVQEAEKLKAQVTELENNWKRALADYQNLEKRVAAEREEFVKEANRNLILKLLPVLESLEKAGQYLKERGLTLAIKQFKEILKNEGLKKIEVVGKQFDPREMECLEAIKGKKENVVAEEISPGYKLGEKVLKVAQVKVYKIKVDKKAEKLAKEELRKGNYM